MVSNQEIRWFIRTGFNNYFINQNLIHICPSLVLFVTNNTVVSTESGKLYISTIEKKKKEIANEYQVTTDDIELVIYGGGILKDTQELSKYDNSSEGISLWDARVSKYN